MSISILNSLIFQFADDTTLLYSSRDPKKIRKVVNHDISLLYTWLCANRLSLSVAKTEFILFNPPGIQLSQRITPTLNKTKNFPFQKLQYLRIILDDRLTRKVHINELNKKLNKTIGIIRRLKDKSVHLVHLKLSIFLSSNLI